jgi:hypothetical protein
VYCQGTDAADVQLVNASPEDSFFIFTLILYAVGQLLELGMRAMY